MLEPDDLREIDRILLGYLTEGRVTPAYGQQRMTDDGVADYTRAYVQQRLARFVEHSHARNLYDTGLYELVDDPREPDD